MAPTEGRVAKPEWRWAAAVVPAQHPKLNITTTKAFPKGLVFFGTHKT